MNIHCTLACGIYDRTHALQTGMIQAEGLDVTYLGLPVEEIFWRQLRYEEFDVAEMSLSSYLIAKDRGRPDFIAIPVFPSRFFRHSSIFVNRDAGIERPRDLIGKRLGVPEYQMTAALWVRGILADEYGVRPNDCWWYSGGEEEAGREEKLPIQVPGVDIKPIARHQTLSAMLLDGEIDALVSARIPSTFYHASGRVGRLFSAFQAVEEAYFAKTKIFPIMHTIVLKRAFYETYPWTAQSLFKAFVASKQFAEHNLQQPAALAVMDPWFLAGLERTQKLMGDDYWPYGIRANRLALETAIAYSHRQGLISRLLTVEELFAPNCGQAFVV